MKVQLDQVGKRFKFEWIFRGVDLSFESPIQYAIQGPNGSGKSTLLKVLSGHLTPSKGKVTFSNAQGNIEIGQVYKSVSFAAPYINLIESFTLTEAIQFHQQFKSFQQDLDTQALIELLNFQKSANKQIRFFSSGMKQRLKLVLALCSDTPILLLDEPTTNLDTQGMEWYRSLIDRFANDRLLIIASNVAVDFDFCQERVNIMDYKKKKNKKA